MSTRFNGVPLVGVLLAALAVVSLTTVPAPAASADPAEKAQPDTACAQAQATEGMQPIRSLSIPEVSAGWHDVDPEYDYEAPSVGTLDRVGYCLELGTADGTQWVWASHQATGMESDTAVPTGSAEVTNQVVHDVVTRSNVSAVPQLDGGEAWLEMWPNTYNREATRLVPGRLDGTEWSADAAYDADDRPTDGSYGSFQVHALTEDAATPALAMNHWAATDTTVDVGIGPNSASPETDWTFAGNASDYTDRRLTFYGREASVEIDQAPQPLQLLPRASQDASSASTTIAGRVVDPVVQGIELTITRSGETETRPLEVVDGEFSGQLEIPVALAETDVSVWAITESGRELVRRIPGLLAGDAYLVQGQSNAVARQYGESAYAKQSPFMRTFGSSTPMPGTSVSSRVWTRGSADTGEMFGTVGQWATQLAYRLIETKQVPVAIIQAGHGGRPVSFFQRDDADPTNPETNYGRMLQRLQESGLQDHLSGVFWNQGEAERNDAETHVAGVRELFADLRADLDSPPMFLMQVRRSPCDDPSLTELRDAQRRLADELHATPISLNGMDTPIGCHWDFPDGYQRLGNWAYRTVRTVVDGEPAAGVLAPNPTGVRWIDDHTIAVDLRRSDPLTIDLHARLGFRVDGGSVSVSSVEQQGNVLLLHLSGPVARGAVVEYVGHEAAGPWVKNQIGTGLLTFKDTAA